MGVEVQRWARACARCQASKIHRHIKAPRATFLPGQHRFKHIHVDIVGPLPSSLGSTHLLTIFDRFTHWPEAFPLPEMSTLMLARVLLHGLQYVFSHNVRSRKPVSLRVVETFLDVSWRRTASDDCISSSSQRPRRKISQRLEGVASHPTQNHRRQLDRPTSVGAPRPEDSLQRGPTNVFSGTRLRRTSHGPRRLRQPVDGRLQPGASSQTSSRGGSAASSDPDVSTRPTAESCAGRRQNSGPRLCPPQRPQRASSTLQRPLQGPPERRQNVPDRCRRL